MKASMLLLFWRAWHLRNDAIHAQGTATIKDSTMFLTSYEKSVGIASQKVGIQVNGKDKEKVWEEIYPEERSLQKEVT
jgi:hypothetical protein